MKVAIVGSRKIVVENLEQYIPSNTTEIISGGAKGIDTCAKQYAQKKSLRYIEFLPEYNVFGKAAPLIRNDKIIDYADIVIAIWDGKSKGTKYVIDQCIKLHKQIEIHRL